MATDPEEAQESGDEAALPATSDGTEPTPREAFGAEFRARLAALAAAPVSVPDDGSLAARLFDQPGLVDAMLGRSVLDPFAPATQGSGLPPDIAALLEVNGPVSVDDVGATVEAIGAVLRTVNRLEALAAVLLERARVQAQRAEGMLEEAEPNVVGASWTRRGELARRSLVAEVANTVHHTEAAVSRRLTEAQALVARAPRTLAAAVSGHVGWRNAGKVADAVAELDTATADRLDAGVVGAARCENPARFTRTVRRIRERVHATPPEVRHQEAATKRYVSVSPSVDGMAYLTLFAPATAVHAIEDRLVTVARATRAGGDPRTQAQLRADVACALLLDDGTLDLEAAATTCTDAAAESELEPPPEGATEPSAFSLARIARSVRPKIYVTVPVLTLLGRADEPGLLDGTVPIDAETAREMAGLSTSFTRLLTAPTSGRIIAVDATTYRPPADLAHYVKVRDTTCRFPGCNRKATQSDVDHTVARADGGPTRAANLATTCRAHHVLKHQARFTVTQSDDGNGTLTWTTPTGRTHTTRPDSVPAISHSAPPRFPEMNPDPGNEEESPPDLGDPPF